MNDDLKQYLVDKNMNILEVLNIINENGQGIVYVSEKDNTLLGSITDGDIRRYILKHRSLDGQAYDVMNSNTKYYSDGDNSISLRRFCLKNNINSLPIIDHDFKILDLFFLNGYRFRKNKIHLPVVIMAGGKGKRLEPYTKILPKPLIPINDKTIIELIMDRFCESGCNVFNIIVNYKKELIKAYLKDVDDKEIIFCDEFKFLGTAGGLKLLNEKLTGTFFLSNCDILIEEDYSKIYEYHRINNNTITLVCALKKVVFPYGIVETTDSGSMLSLKEKPTFEYLTNTGFYLIEPEFLNFIEHNSYSDMPDVIQRCIENKKKVGVYPIKEDSWIDMGQIEGLEKMRRLFNG